jgi:hypothetical protein
MEKNWGPKFEEIRLTNQKPEPAGQNLYKYRKWPTDLNDKDFVTHRKPLLSRELFLADIALFEDRKDSKIRFSYDLLDLNQWIEKLYYLAQSHYLNLIYQFRFNRVNFNEYYLLNAEIVQAKKIVEDPIANLANAQKMAKEYLINCTSPDFVTELNKTNFHTSVEESFGVCSLSSVADSVKMWNDYADNLTGYCIGLDKRAFEDLWLATPLPMIYYEADTYPEILPVFHEGNMKHGLDHVRLTMCLKQDKYRYENEYRIALMWHKGGSIVIPATMITEVWLGPKMPEIEQDCIKSFVRENYPNAICQVAKVR